MATQQIWQRNYPNKNVFWIYRSGIRHDKQEELIGEDDLHKMSPLIFLSEGIICRKLLVARFDLIDLSQKLYIAKMRHWGRFIGYLNFILTGLWLNAAMEETQKEVPPGHFKGSVRVADQP